MRIYAWQVFQSKPIGWDFMDPESHPLSFALVEQAVLISHVLVSWRALTHAGETYQMYGLSAVFTYPQFEKQGYGRHVVGAATAHILASDADVAMLGCKPQLIPFYAASGWSDMPATQILCGPQSAPAKGGHVMMLFVSEKGRQNRLAFEREPVYVGEYMW
jgi:predicted N-acetyltransferase YhbS